DGRPLADFLDISPSIRKNGVIYTPLTLGQATKLSLSVRLSSTHAAQLDAQLNADQWLEVVDTPPPASSSPSDAIQRLSWLVRPHGAAGEYEAILRLKSDTGAELLNVPLKFIVADNRPALDIGIYAHNEVVGGTLGSEEPNRNFGDDKLRYVLASEGSETRIR